MTEPWPPAPVGVSGSVVLRLLGMKLATIRLDLAIYATDRLARWLEATDAPAPRPPIERIGHAPAANRRFRPPNVAGSAGSSVRTRASRTALPSAPRRDAGRPRHARELPRNGAATTEQGELREILQLLAKTSKMLE